MLIAPETIIRFLDLFGVFTSAVAATVLAKRQHLDIFGAVMIAFVASIGGGTIRDLLLNRHPMFWLQDLSYAYLITATSLITQVFYYQFERLDKPFRWFDALALATFTVIGIEIAQIRVVSPPVAVLMGVITAVMGGILRDIVCRQVPLILQKEIYLTAAMIGGIFYFVLLHFGVSLWLRDLLTMLLVLIIRGLAIIYNWNLPNIAIQRRR
ncbi:MAG: trimeric intracellular cation channel family protein [Cardiobacteriaceae bacterium]|nr:trimeric intracellular cation channel family protein [Cardiobacteriaceae bacterium]